MYNNRNESMPIGGEGLKTVRIRSKEDLFRMKDPENAFGRVTALGFFDGVHTAHRELIKRAKAIADGLGLALSVFTFSAEGGIKSNSARLYSDEDKLAILSECGANEAFLCDFSAVSELSPKEFTQSILIEALNTDVAVCGYNFRFGKGALASSSDLSELMAAGGRRAEIIPEIRIEGKEISSSRIRELLASGKAGEAGELLGEPYFASGTVERGKGIGEGLGIPTLNTPLPLGRFPLKRGVYASAVRLGGKVYAALSNVGNCPTFGERESHIETNVLGFSGNAYGENVRIYFLEYLRDEKVFDNEKELIKQINIDKSIALKILEDEKWQELGLKYQ